MIQQALVISTNDKIATVKVQRHSSCKSCGACQMGSGSKTIEVKTINKIAAVVGDFVEIEVPTHKVMKASFLMYIIPILTLILGLYIGGLMGESQGINRDLASGIMGLLMMVTTFGAIRLYDRRIQDNKDYSPEIIKIIDESERVVV